MSPSKKVLVIDDEPHFVAAVKRTLEPLYQVFTAFNGAKGVELALQNRPDLILCDILMPKKDGYQVLRELRAHTETRDTPIILLTAVAGTGSVMDTKEMGATDYLIKPIKLADLPGLVADYIRTGPML